MISTAATARRTALLALLPVVALAALVTVLLAGARSAGSQTPTVTMAPAFELADVREPSSTVRFDGAPTRPTLLNFFGAWCEPCREELPYLAAEAKARPGIDVVLVDVQDVRSDAVALLRETGADFPAGSDPKREIARRYRLRGMPATILVAPGGRVVAMHQGPVGRRDLRRMLDMLEAA